MSMENKTNGIDGSSSDEFQNIKKQFKSEMKQTLPWKSLVQFCLNCGSYLHIKADSDTTQCQRCNTENQISLNIKSKSKIIFDEPRQWLKGTGTTDTGIKSEDRAIINQQCENCGHDKSYQQTRQLRSVDEGETVFMECVSCKKQVTLNN